MGTFEEAYQKAIKENGCNAGETFARYIFRAGAEWRIDCVWHNMKDEEPKPYGDYENDCYPQIPCLVYGQLSTGTGYGVRYWNAIEKCWDDEECDDYECDKDAVEEWAYIDDLLPNQTEV